MNCCLRQNAPTHLRILFGLCLRQLPELLRLQRPSPERQLQQRPFRQQPPPEVLL